MEKGLRISAVVKNRASTRRSLFLLGASIATVACSGSAPSAGEPIANGSATLLASETAPNGDTVEFYKLQSGAVHFVDTFRYGGHSFLEGKTDGLSAIEVYKLVAPGRPVPQALEDAWKFSDVHRVNQLDIAPPPQIKATSAPAFYDFNAWFASIACTGSNVTSCVELQVPQTIATPWVYGSYYQAIAGVDGPNSGAAYFTVYHWNGSAQVLDFSTYVDGGSAVFTTTWEAAPGQYHYSALSPVNNSGEMDLAVHNTPASIYPYECTGAANEVCFQGSGWFAEQIVNIFFQYPSSNDPEWSNTRPNVGSVTVDGNGNINQGIWVPCVDADPAVIVQAVGNRYGATAQYSNYYQPNCF